MKFYSPIYHTENQQDLKQVLGVMIRISEMIFIVTTYEITKLQCNMFRQRMGLAKLYWPFAIYVTKYCKIITKNQREYSYQYCTSSYI